MQKNEFNNSKNMNNVLKSKVSIAPMAGITDYVLRDLVRKHSKTCLLTTEMISSEALNQNSKNEDNNKITKLENSHHPIAYQLAGHKPEMMANAAKMLQDKADIIDINMGCPVNKIVKGQDGCALMNTPQLAATLVKAVDEAVLQPISVKFRLGYSQMNFVEFGQQMQEAGAKFITIHARTRSQMYTGKADWEKIRQLKENVDIPVFANGDILSIESAIQCLEASRADGIAIGRGILGDVTLAARIEHYLKTGEQLPAPTLDEKISTLKSHLEGEIQLRGENLGIKFCRKFYPYYINSIQSAAKYRGALVLMEDYEKIIATLDDIAAKEHAEAL